MSPRPVFLLAAVAFASACDGGSAATGDAAVPAMDTGSEAPGSLPVTFSDTCAPAGSPGQAGQMLTSNNAVELSGALLGSRDVIPGLLRRPVSITVREPSTRLTLGPAFIVRSSESSKYVTLIASVTNPGSEYLCWLEAVDLRWLAADGSELLKDAFGFVRGSVGDSNGIATDTCLGPGEVGYLTDIETAPAERPLFTAGSIKLAFEARRGGRPVPGSLFATSYIPCKGSRQFEVLLESRGPMPVGLWDSFIGTYFLFDDEGPVDYGLLSTRRGLGIYNPGKMTVGGSANFYPGPVTKIRVYASFDYPMDL